MARKLDNFRRPNFSHNLSQDRIKSFSATLADQTSGVILTEKHSYNRGFLSSEMLYISLENIVSLCRAFFIDFFFFR